MAEDYTCTCGGLAWYIKQKFIYCTQCETGYKLRIIPALDGEHVIEKPEAFNKRIRDDLLSDIINDKEG